MAALYTQTHTQRYKGPSFSSSLLDSIYRSIDEIRISNDHQEPENLVHHRRKDADEDIESLRRAIMIEKWMESYTNSTTTPIQRHFPSNSASSTDSSMFSSSETESPASRSSPKPPHKPKQAQPPQPIKLKTGLNREGRFTMTKSKARKIYGELKKVKEPISPGGKIANFLNSIFSPRNMKTNQGPEEWGPMRKSKSMKDTTTSTLASRSCLSKNVSSGGSKSKRSVRFCPVGVIVDEDCQPCGRKNIYDDDDDDDEYSIGSQFIKKNIDSFRVHGKQEYRDENEYDIDDMSCASSDLFELENIGRAGVGVGVGIGSCEEELPVYGSTSLVM